VKQCNVEGGMGVALSGGESPRVIVVDSFSETRPESWY
jgi:hypothetical protein